MLLGPDVSLNVFKLSDDGTFECIAEIDEYTSLIWPEEWVGFATVEVNANLTDNVKRFLVPGNIIWAGGESAAEIYYADKAYDEDGNETYKVKANTLEYLLARRIVWNTYNGNDLYASQVMHQLVSQNAVNPAEVSRKIPFLKMASDISAGGKITYQTTGAQLTEALSEVCESTGLGYRVIFDPAGKTLTYETRAGVDRSVDQDIVTPVMLSTDLEDILESSYNYNAQDYRNVALVAGESLVEGQESPRKTQTAGEIASEGLKRYELYVDANDVQSKTKNEAGEDVTLTDVEYNAALSQRGYDELANWKVTESFDASIRTFGEQVYKFGVDYDIGDIVTVVDERLGIQVNALVTTYQEEYDDDYNVDVTFGYSRPTLMTKLKKKIY